MARPPEIRDLGPTEEQIARMYCQRQALKWIVLELVGTAIFILALIGLGCLSHLHWNS